MGTGGLKQPGHARPIGRVAVGAALLLATTACATKRDVRDLRAAMQEQAMRQDSAIASLADLIRTLNEAAASDQSIALMEFRGDVSRQLLEVMDQLIQVQELSGQNQRTLTQLRDQAESERARLNARPATPVTSNDSDAQAAYDASYSAYQNRSLTAATRGFEAFIRQYPNHPEAPSAQYFLADILYQEGDVEEAVSGFLLIPELYPTSERVPEALYRLGLIELEQGDSDEARRYFQRVVSSYPDSDVAQVASERLAEIG